MQFQRGLKSNRRPKFWGAIYYGVNRIESVVSARNSTAVVIIGGASSRQFLISAESARRIQRAYRIVDHGKIPKR